jgi:hypothetical protein
MFSGLAAAVLSISMLGGVVAWAYQISARDPHDVPVIRAIEGPMKVRPEKTGGLELEEKDLAVTRMVSGDSGIKTETLAPAAEQPAPGDKPAPVLRQEAEMAGKQPAAAPAELAAPGGDDTVNVKVSSAPPPPAPEVRAPEAPAAATTKAEAGMSSTTGTPVATLENVSPQAPDASPVAPQRPKTIDAKPAEETKTASTASTTNTPVARAVAPIGAPVVQLGAFSTHVLAERTWQDQQIINGKLFKGKQASITPVQSGGRELWRLRVGPFDDDEEAKKVCVVLKARGGDCIVTRTE